MMQRDVSEKTATVYMPESCYHEMLRHVYTRPCYECGGFLIGDRQMRDGAPVISIRALYREPLVGTEASFSFDMGYTERAMAYESAWRREHGGDDFIVGTYHSHGNFDAFISSVDAGYIKTLNLMLIVSPRTRRIEVWYWQLGASRLYRGRLVVYRDEETTVEGRTLRVQDETLSLGGRSYPMRTYCGRRTVRRPRSHVAIVGCGTLGNLLSELIGEGLDAEITFVDLDAYEEVNLPRSPMIDARAVGQYKAFALAEALARRGKYAYPVHGIVADARELTVDFFSRFDAILTPLDNLECRYYVSYCAAVTGTPLINLGTSYAGLGGTPFFSGDVYCQTASADTCLDCFYSLYRGNEATLRRRVSCGTAAPAQIAPQVISSSMLVAAVAYACLRRVLCGNADGRSHGYRVSDVWESDAVLSGEPVKAAPACSFRPLHTAERPIPTVRASRHMRLSLLYERVRAAFADASGTCYELDMMGSALTLVKYRHNHPIHSILLEEGIEGRVYQVLGKEYFPHDHVFSVHSDGRVRYLRIQIK